MSLASQCLSNANLKYGEEILWLIHMGTSRSKLKEGEEKLNVRESCWQSRAEFVQIFQRKQWDSFSYFKKNLKKY